MKQSASPDYPESEKQPPPKHQTYENVSFIRMSSSKPTVTMRKKFESSKPNNESTIDIKSKVLRSEIYKSLPLDEKRNKQGTKESDGSSKTRQKSSPSSKIMPSYPIEGAKKSKRVSNEDVLQEKQRHKCARSVSLNESLENGKNLKLPGEMRKDANTRSMPKIWHSSPINQNEKLPHSVKSTSNTTTKTGSAYSKQAYPKVLFKRQGAINLESSPERTNYGSNDYGKINPSPKSLAFNSSGSVEQTWIKSLRRDSFEKNAQSCSNKSVKKLPKDYPSSNSLPLNFSMHYARSKSSHVANNSDSRIQSVLKINLGQDPKQYENKPASQLCNNNNTPRKDSLHYDSVDVTKKSPAQPIMVAEIFNSPNLDNSPKVRLYIMPNVPSYIQRLIFLETKVLSRQ